MNYKKIMLFSVVWLLSLVCVINTREIFREASCAMFIRCYFPYNSYCNGDGKCITVVLTGGWADSPYEVFIYDGINDFVPEIDRSYIKLAHDSDFCVNVNDQIVDIYLERKPISNTLKSDYNIVVGKQFVMNCLNGKHLAPYSAL